MLGCSGSVPGPDRPGLVVPGGARRLPPAARPRQRRLRRAAAAPRPGGGRRGGAVPPAPGPLPRPVPVRGVPAVRPGRAAGAGIPLLGPAGTHDRLAAAYDPHGPRRAARRVRLRRRDRRGSGSSGRSGCASTGSTTRSRRTRSGSRRAAGRSPTPATPAPSDALVRLAAGSDLLLCEASYPDGQPHPPNLHLSGREAGEHAAKAGVGRLLVTHVPPWTDRDRIGAEAAAAFPGPPSSPPPTPATPSSGCPAVPARAGGPVPPARAGDGAEPRGEHMK